MFRRAAFASIILRQKTTNQNVSAKKLRAKLLYEKAVRKKLVKLTPDLFSILLRTSDIRSPMVQRISLLLLTAG
jgi:hypothetical protein